MKTTFPIAELSDADVAFPARVSRIMPAMEAIPEEFRRGRTAFNELFSDWFFIGIKNLELSPKDGVDKVKALRHIRAIMSSFEPKHEHKAAACAYLLSQWFTSPKWERAE